MQNPSDDRIRDILRSVRTIALLGASPKPERPSHGVMRFLLGKGYHVIPVNPGQAGKEINGQRVVARLADIAEPVDMVDVFREPYSLPGIVDEVLAMNPRPPVLWTQLGVVNEDAARRAREAGLQVVMDRCPAIEYPRLIESAALALEPHRLAFYLYDLASTFHAHWNRGTENPDLRFVKVNDRQLTLARLGLVQAVSDVLTSGLALIGAEAPSEMR